MGRSRASVGAANGPADRTKSAGVESAKEVSYCRRPPALRASRSRRSRPSRRASRTTSRRTPPRASTGSASGSSSCPRTATTPRRSRPSSGAVSSPRRRCRSCRRSCRCRASAGRPIRPSGSTRSARRSTGSRRFRPSGIVCLTGSGIGLDPDDARTIVADGLRTLAAEAELRRRPDRARAVPARRRRGLDDRDHDPGGGRADRGGGRPSVAAAPVRRVAPLEHADAARRHRPRGRPLRRRPRLGRPQPDAQLGRPRAARRRRRRRAGGARGARRGRLARAVRPGDLLRRRHVRQCARRFALDVPAGELARRGRAAMLAAWERRPRAHSVRDRSTNDRRKDEIRKDRRGRARGRSRRSGSEPAPLRTAPRPPSRPARRS